MTAAIGSFTFVSIKGPQVPALAVAMSPIDRAGVDGTAFRQDARKVPEIQLEATAVAADLAAANIACDLYAALVGTLTTIVDDLGRSVGSVAVLGVLVFDVRALVNASPSTAAYLIRSVWRVKPTL